MEHYKIVMEPFDASADSRIKIFGGHNTGDFYILDTDMSKTQIENDLRQTAESVEVIEISKAEFESLSREKVGFYASKPE
ncbi:MAG TPA: hypothetical protein VGR73_20885 [Bryobacteraceae bacterium]|nr:hypothetical protein [Bryobacteraceae bacterium]